MESVDEKLDAFNDLFLPGLDNHAPIKTVKLRRFSFVIALTVINKVNDLRVSRDS